MGKTGGSKGGWNCLVESIHGTKFHAGFLDEGGALQDVACNIQNRNGWQLVRPAELSMFEVCTRCLYTGAIDNIPGVKCGQEGTSLPGTTMPIATITFDPNRYNPPVNTIHEVAVNESPSL